MARCSAVTEQMQELTPHVRCETYTQDEIGMLAENVNSLYQTLLSTIQDLEQEIQKVEAADVQKTNFLRAASHELKTPVTAVSAMLENMILNVGKYKDRDTYLAKCKDLTDRLAQMIKEILDASKAEFAGNKECTDFLISDVIGVVMEPYQIIAKAKELAMNVKLDGPCTVCLPRGMIEKVISNILATADDFIYPSGMLSGPVSGNTESAWNTNFTNSVLRLAEGRHISKKDKNAALVSRELAEENNLQIGRELTFSDPPATVKIVGIYVSDASMEFDTDTIFTDLSTAGNSIERVDFFVTDPAELETVMARIEGDNYTLQANKTEYDAISMQLAVIGRLTTALIVAAIVVGATVLFLILAMGIPKRNILAQFLIETSALLLLAKAISCPISCLAIVQIGAVLKSTVGTASVTISPWKLLAQYATEMTVITGGVVAVTYPAMRLQPKEILSKMS